MADLIDRQALFPNKVFYVNANNPETSLNELINRICNAPTVDAVKVVRCKDCKHYVEAYKGAYGGDCAWRECITDNTDFCSYGERRENDGCM